MFKKGIVILAIVAVLAAVAHGPAAMAAAPDDAALVLPEGVVLDEAELAEVQGAVLKTAAIGALAGFGAYAVGQLYDGIVHGEWSWSWADAGKAAVTGAVAGAIGKFF